MSKSWKIVTLEDAARWGSGGTPSRSESSYYGGDIPWVKTGDLNNHELHEASEYITDEGLKNSSAKIFPSGSVGIAMYGATIGKTALFKIDAATNQACAVATAYKGVSNRFLHYYLQSQKQNFIEKGKGGAQPNISQGVIKQHPFPLPPYSEQQRIVAQLDQLMACHTKVKAVLDEFPEQLKRFRKAVFQSAFNKNYETKQLSDLAEIIGGVTKGRKLEGKETITLPYLRVANVQDGYLNLDTVKEIEVLPKDLEKYRLLIGDVLFTEGGDRDKLGRGTVWENEIPHCIHQNHIFRARVIDSNLLLPQFLSYYRQSPDGKEFFFLNGKHTTNLASINKSVLSRLPVPVPSVDQQRKIVDRIEALLAVENQLRLQHASLKSKLDSFPQALLAKAFRGELVEQDPNDEPAEKLLQRIKAARQALESKKKTTRKKK
jgi:type I restriction enzyme S subunit